MVSTVATAFLRTVQIPMTLLAATGLYGILFPKQAIIKDNFECDYIVVGGGTAGSVVTRRLAEDGKNTVFMIEAGFDPPITALLAEFFDLLPASYVDYNYTSTPDKLAAAGQGGHTMITAGKMLGGSASLNHYMYNRGTSSDFDCWAKISKKEHWGYKHVLPYFIKAERIADEEIIRESPDYHGTDGPLGVSRELFDEDVEEYLKSFAETGTPTVLDLTADKYIGYTQPIYTVADKKRQTPALSYLKPIKKYRNLYVTKKSRVTKIIFEGNVAIGVQYIYKGKTFTARARKEVIICAGVFNTPQLLMLSGIGPEDHLKALNIEVKSNLPVGDKMRDHVAVTIVHKVKPYKLPLPEPSAILLDPTKIPFPIMVGSVALNKSQTCPDYQTYNFIIQHDTWYLTLVCKAFFGYRNDICDRWQKQVKSRDSMYTTLAHMQPRSTGTVRLRSTNPFDDPVIKTGYYKSKKDLEDIVKFIKHFLQVTRTNYFKEIGADVVGLELPDCAGKEIGSDDYWRCYALTLTCSAYDFCGSCPMGTVVDGNLKVKGFERLRIVDASVMPTIPRGRINAIVIMIAEKAAKMILEENH